MPPRTVIFSNLDDMLPGPTPAPSLASQIDIATAMARDDAIDKDAAGARAVADTLVKGVDRLSSKVDKVYDAVTELTPVAQVRPRKQSEETVYLRLALPSDVVDLFSRIALRRSILKRQRLSPNRVIAETVTRSVRKIASADSPIPRTDRPARLGQGKTELIRITVPADVFNSLLELAHAVSISERKSITPFALAADLAVRAVSRQNGDISDLPSEGEDLFLEENTNA